MGVGTGGRMYLKADVTPGNSRASFLRNAIQTWLRACDRALKTK